MIDLDIFNQDGTLAQHGEWEDERAGAMNAHVTRWLSRNNRWARITEPTGRIRTRGSVPEGQEAPVGHYQIHRLGHDGKPEPEPVKVFSSKTAPGRAEQWRLDNRLGGNGELATLWVADKSAEEEPGQVMSGPLAEAQLTEAGAGEYRILTDTGRRGQLTGFVNVGGQPDVQFDDGSRYPITAARIVWAAPAGTPEPEAQADNRCSTCHRDAHRPGRGGVHGHPYTPPQPSEVPQADVDGVAVPLAPGTRVATAEGVIRGVVTEDAVPAGHVPVLRVGGDYAIPIPVHRIVIARPPGPRLGERGFL